jgi:predicted AAA+ superfamily ATPase
MERVCTENELVITTWSPIHLRTKLKALYWKDGQPSAGAMAFWEDTLRYLYLPRLKDRDVGKLSSPAQPDRTFSALRTASKTGNTKASSSAAITCNLTIHYC